MGTPSDAIEMKHRLADWWQSSGAFSYLYDTYNYLIEKHTERVDKLKQAIEIIDRTGNLDSASEEVRIAYDETYALRLETMGPSVEADLADSSEDRVQAWVDARHRQMTLSDAYWVKAEMVALVNAAYASRPVEPLRSDHPPKPLGFAWLEAPALMVTERNGTNVGFRAVSWCPSSDDVGPGLRITFWTETSVLPEKHRSMAVANYHGSSVLPWSVFWRWGLEDPADIAMGAEDAHGVRWVQAFWSLMMQPLATVAAEPLPRAARRRLQRDGRPEHEVRVISLRAARHSQQEPAGTRNYQHRWVVRGFWRKQWYPSSGEHRPIWIDDYIKGPADRPFLINEKVYAWRR